MRKIAILILCLFAAGCAKVETASTENTLTTSNKTVAVAPTVETEVALKTATPNVKLNAKQQKYLNESLPPKVREILEKAEKFEILAEVNKEGEDDGEWTTFEPNRTLKVVAEKDKQAILETFYHDAAREDSPAICFYPRLLVRAIYQAKTVEIEICFSCSRYFVKGDFGEFDGTIVRENRKSEDLFKQIIESKGVEIKQ